MKYYPRAIEKKLQDAIKQFPVVVLTGPRQSGKSTLLQHNYPDYHYITFDDPLLRQNAVEDPGLFMENIDLPVILDEIQYVPQLLPYIKMAVDKDRHRYGQFILTGSQVFNLMQNLSESLAGRAAILELLPFTLEEMKHLDSLKLKDLFDICFKGFYPDPAVHQVDARLFYGSYLQTYIERDIRQLKSVHDVALFQRFMGLLAARSASILNLSNVASACGISHTTAQNWLSLLESSRIVYLLRPFSGNLNKRLVKSPKIYFTDTGLLTYLLKYPTAETLLHGPMAGAVFENFLIIEALKYKVNALALFEMFYYRDSNKNEIDLLLDEAGEMYLFEIKMKHNIIKKDYRFLDFFTATQKKLHKFLISVYDKELALSSQVKNIPWYLFPRKLKELH